MSSPPSSTPSIPIPIPIPIPILLLKSPSSNRDPYATHFSPPRYKPTFLPPLRNVPVPTPPSLTAALATTPPLSSSSYAGLVFTSQRAVGAFATALAAFASPVPSADSGKGSRAPSRAALLAQVRLPLYAVGPATACALRAEVQTTWLTACWVVGEEAGRGEVLAELMVKELLPHQRLVNGVDGEVVEGNTENVQRVLFITGQTRRDVIPQALREAGISVEEVIVYATAIDPLFENTVREAVATPRTDEGIGIRWVIIFSPQGSREFLRALGWLDEEDQQAETGRMKAGVMSDVERRTFVVGIGPTTREYLEQEFGLRVDVQAARPSPDGVREGIQGFMRQRGWVDW